MPAPAEPDVIDRKDVVEKKEPKLDHPKAWQVVMHNDDFTPFEFVVIMLLKIFNKNLQEAENLMMAIHKGDKGVCGVYSHDVAETKVKEVMDWAKVEGHPLMLHAEPQD